jgi:parallel beta-helix repeat protein
MKTSIISIFLFCLLALNAQTVISNKSEVFGKWNKKGSPYIISGEAIIPTDKTLNIEPGVIVKFKTGKESDYWDNKSFDKGFLRVNGTLIAKGNKKNPIIFTRVGDDGIWGNIFIDSKSEKNLLSYCVFEHSHYIRSINETDNSTAALSFYKSAGTVENCLFANNGWTAINCKEGATPKINNCTIVQNQYGIECNSASNPVIKNCIVGNNKSSNFYINGGSTPVISYSLIQDNKLAEGILDGGNNILNTKPVFKAPLTGNFQLDNNSLGKKKGEKKKDMGVIY